MISDKDVKAEMKFYEDLRKYYKSKFRGYPEGRIVFRREHGKHRPYININDEYQYLKRSDARLISRLLEKRITERKIKQIEKNLKTLRILKQSYKGPEYFLGDGAIKEIENKIGNGFKVENFLIEPKKENDNNSAADFRTDQKIHTTPAGIAVRSRAELVIATFLEMKGIDYTYEKPVKLFLRTVAPDFTIKRKSDGKTIIWEHFGMMDDPEYYESRMELLSDYHHSGWLPYDNLIATFGEKNSPIDMTAIETICETMLK